MYSHLQTPTIKNQLMVLQTIFYTFEEINKSD